MDPYLESPGLWPDFHDRYATQISAVLNQTLPRPYYAQLAQREQIDVFDEAISRRIISDVAVHRDPTGRTSQGVAVLEQPRSELSESIVVEFPLDQAWTSFVEVRDGSRGHEVVTVIELISPSNKRPGPDCDAYRTKRDSLLRSSTSLVEIDLLRDGPRLWAGVALDRQFQSLVPRPEYLAVVNTAWERPRTLRFEVFPIRLDRALPVIPIPLREGQERTPLDLQFAFERTYADGPYARSVDYSRDPEPLLPADAMSWVNERLLSFRS
jgi:hypothetical protein